jgi:hypothetical protein
MRAFWLTLLHFPRPEDRRLQHARNSVALNTTEGRRRAVERCALGLFHELCSSIMRLKLAMLRSRLKLTLT